MWFRGVATDGGIFGGHWIIFVRKSLIWGHKNFVDFRHKTNNYGLQNWKFRVAKSEIPRQEKQTHMALHVVPLNGYSKIVWKFWTNDSELRYSWRNVRVLQSAVGEYEWIDDIDDTIISLWRCSINSVNITLNFSYTNKHQYSSINNRCLENITS